MEARHQRNEIQIIKKRLPCLNAKAFRLEMTERVGLAMRR
jgi:hypothetical protein